MRHDFHNWVEEEKGTICRSCGLMTLSKAEFVPLYGCTATPRVPEGFTHHHFTIDEIWTRPRCTECGLTLKHQLATSGCQGFSSTVKDIEMDDEIILEIEEYKLTDEDREKFHEESQAGTWRPSFWSDDEGFKIITTAQEILLLIDTQQSCCENTGYFLTEDDTEKFIGESILGIEVTDTNRSSRVVFERGWSYEREERDPEKEYVYLDEGDTMFVDIKTTRGILQFVAYNSHNGYYGHTAKIISTQVTEEKGV